VLAGLIPYDSGGGGLTAAGGSLKEGHGGCAPAFSLASLQLAMHTSKNNNLLITTNETK
jgi:hypothetical protein